MVDASPLYTLEDSASTANHEAVLLARGWKLDCYWLTALRPAHPPPLCLFKRRPRLRVRLSVAEAGEVRVAWGVRAPEAGGRR